MRNPMTANGRPRVRVLIVDDSAVVRETLTQLFNSDPRLTVMETASDPFVAAQIIRHQVPDVIILDVEMPRMDGVTFLTKIMSQHPVPVVMCSTRMKESSRALAAALAAGAVDVICKPDMSVKGFLEASSEEICDIVFHAAHARVTAIELTRNEFSDSDRPAPVRLSLPPRVIAIAASTGGTEALRVLLTDLPKDCPPIVIVQHMQVGFTRPFAEHLDSCCRISVREATEGALLRPGQALIAPGGRHLRVGVAGMQMCVTVDATPPVSGHRPSADVLFHSLAEMVGEKAMGIILTGMGHDGVEGLLRLRKAGAQTLGQDEATCVVYGMPKMAKRAGAIEKELPLHLIGRELLAFGQTAQTPVPHAVD